MICRQFHEAGMAEHCQIAHGDIFAAGNPEHGSIVPAYVKQRMLPVRPFNPQRGVPYPQTGAETVTARWNEEVFAIGNRHINGSLERGLVVVADFRRYGIAGGGCAQSKHLSRDAGYAGQQTVAGVKRNALSRFPVTFPETHAHTVNKRQPIATDRNARTLPDPFAECHRFMPDHGLVCRINRHPAEGDRICRVEMNYECLPRLRIVKSG